MHTSILDKRGGGPLSIRESNKNAWSCRGGLHIQLCQTDNWLSASISDTFKRFLFAIFSLIETKINCSVASLSVQWMILNLLMNMFQSGWISFVCFKQSTSLCSVLDNISENCTLKCGNWSFSFQAVCSKYICQVLELDRPSCARFDELVFALPSFYRQIEYVLLVLTTSFSLHWLMCVWNTQDNFWLRSLSFLYKELVQITKYYMTLQWGGREEKAAPLLLIEWDG